MILQPLPLSWFEEQLATRARFRLARYGDGEFAAMLGETGQTCDGQTYGPELADALRESLADDRLIHCLGHKADERYPALASELDSVTWYTEGAILRASLAGKLSGVITALYSQVLLFVGPAHLKKLPFGAPVIVTPSDAFRHRSMIITGIINAARAVQPDVILFSCGPLAKVLVSQLGKKLAASLWDVGSVWDMYCGVNSRSYARNLTPAQITALKNENFGRGW